MRFTLDQIEALDAIEREGSFAAAAARLGKAQSAVSYAIRTLEDALGVDVFDRSGHRASLTPEGVALLDEGRLLLSRARRLEGMASSFSRGWEPRLVFVVDGALPQEPILDALVTLGAEGVPTHIEVRMEFLGGVQRRFERTDAALMAVKDLRPASNLVAEPLPDVEMSLVVAPTHPLAGSTEAQLPASLVGHIELSVHDSSDETAGVDTNDIGGARVFYLSDFHTKRLALLRGLGFGWIPTSLVAADLAEGRLVRVPYVGGSTRRFTPHIVHRSDRPLGPAAARLRQLLVVRDGAPKAGSRAD